MEVVKFCWSISMIYFYFIISDIPFFVTNVIITFSWEQWKIWLYLKSHQIFCYRFIKLMKSVRPILETESLFGSHNFVRFSFIILKTCCSCLFIIFGFKKLKTFWNLTKEPNKNQSKEIVHGILRQKYVFVPWMRL